MYQQPKVERFGTLRELTQALVPLPGMELPLLHSTGGKHHWHHGKDGDCDQGGASHS